MSELGSLLERELAVIPPADYGIHDVAHRRNRRQRDRRLGTILVALVLGALAIFGLVRAFGDVDRRVPAQPPPTGTILFARELPGVGFDYLFRARPEGSGASRLVPWSADTFDVSPDGSLVLVPDFSVTGPGWVKPGIVRLDGSGLESFRTGGRTLALWPADWSPDGSRFVGTGHDDTDPTRDGIYTARTSDGGDLVRLTTSTRPARDRVIGYGPDGSVVLFTRPVKQVANDDAVQDLMVVNVDGTDVHQLNPEGTTVRTMPLQASWSPDGRVAFIAARGSPREVRTGPPSRAVFVVGGDGGEPTRLTSWGDVTTARWSPDGGWIAFGRVDEDGDENVYRVRPDGSDLRPVTSSEDGLSSTGPVWSQDGEWLLVLRSSDRSRFAWTLWRVRADGTDLTRITDRPGEYWWYGWSSAEP